MKNPFCVGVDILCKILYNPESVNQLKAKNRKYYKQTTTKEQKTHPIGEKS